MDDVRERLSKLSLEERLLLERQLLARPSPTRARAEPATQNAPKPLSFAQESLWFFHQLLPESALYHMPQAFRLQGELDVEALQRAFQSVVRRQQALRTRFIAQDGTAWQVVQDKAFQLQCNDLSTLAVPARETESQRLIDQEIRRPFHLAEDLLLRARLIRLQEREHILVVVAHHIVADFASLHIVHQELAEAYRQIRRGEAGHLPDLPIQFTELAAQERRAAESPEREIDYAYWQDRFNAAVPSLYLPADRPRGQTRSFDGSRRLLRLPVVLSERLKKLSRDEGVTLYMLLLAGFQTLLYRYSGQEDIVVGSPIEKRDATGSEQLIGLFLNTLGLRGDLSGDPGFRDLLQRTRALVSGALAHQSVPVEKLLERLRLPRKAAVNPLYQVVFQYLPSEWPQPALEGVSVEVVEVHTGTAKFDLTLTALESQTGLLGELEYNSSLFDAARIDRMLGHYRVLLEHFVADPDQHISRVPLLTASERHELVVEWNARALSEYPRARSVHALFEEQAEQTPDAVALVAGADAITYDELNRRANQLAHYLRRIGVQPEQPVGLCLERSLPMITALLAILKAGGCYVPLDPKYPRERVSFMVRDSGVALVLTTAELYSGSLVECQPVFLDEASERIAQEANNELPALVAADALAYILYTSGSTGQPKGVAIPHRAVVRLVKDTNYARFAPDEVFLQFAPISFDASTFEIWGALLNGARLVLYPKNFDSLEQFGEVLRRSGVTTLWLTAGLFQQMVDQQIEALAGVRQLLAGGDVLSVPHVRRVLERLPNCQLINGYGPTENTTFSCCYRFPRDWDGEGTAPIGRPISNTQAYIVDPHLAPVPIGVPGELCLAGDGLAREYWRSPELTARKFVPNPFSGDPQARLYRTGDQARYRADGTIEFLGRLDDQVKINGFRMHLGEVETALLALPGISQAAVLAGGTTSGTKSLAAYVVPELGAALTSQSVRELLLDKIPAFMIPAQVTFLSQLPLTANGKIDRRALPPAVQPSAPSTARLGAPPTPAQEQVLQIWQEVFGRQDIGLDDNFFDLGGHSLIATRVVSRINHAFQSNLSLAALFRTPTVRALTEKLGELQGTATSTPIKRRARAPHGS